MQDGTVRPSSARLSINSRSKSAAPDEPGSGMSEPRRVGGGYQSLCRLRRVAARARFMTTDEASAALDRYQQAHPAAWDRLRQAIEKAAGHPVGQLPMAELLLAPASPAADRTGDD